MAITRPARIGAGTAGRRSATVTAGQSAWAISSCRSDDGAGSTTIEVADRIREDGPRLRSDRGIGHQHVGLVESGDRADPDDAPLRVIGDDDETAARLDERPVRLRLEQVRAGEAGTRIHAVHADEDEVDVDRAQCGHGEWSGQRVGWRPHATGQDDRLIVPADLVEHVRDSDRIGHDGEARDAGEPLGQRVRRGPGRDRDRHPGLGERDGRIGDRIFLALLECRLRREAGFEQGVTGDRGRPAVDLLEETALMEDLQVAADGHVGDTEIADEVGHTYGSVLPDTVKDEGLALSRKHQATLTEPCRRIALDPRRSWVDPTEIAAQPTESQRIQTMQNKKPAQVLDMAGADKDNPAGPVGFCRHHQRR